MDVTSILLDVIILIIFLILRTLLTNWLALKLKWETSFKKGFLVNLTWILILVIISLFIIFIGAPVFIGLSIYYETVYLIFSFLVFILNFITGIFIIKNYYKKEYWGVIVVTIIVLISERIILVIINMSIFFFFEIMFLGGIYFFTPF